MSCFQTLNDQMFDLPILKKSVVCVIYRTKGAGGREQSNLNLKILKELKKRVQISFESDLTVI